MRRIGGYLLAATGLLACPCHLPLTLPVLAATLGGTALGAALLEHPAVVGTLLTGYFLAAVLVGVRLAAGPTSKHERRGRHAHQDGDCGCRDRRDRRLRGHQGDGAGVDEAVRAGVGGGAEAGG
ncbi:MAG: hypothetical protein M3Q65_18130 [Chloroflexota bacterium]|nr:hypothetical protein [Chloroflexota bacterium]